MSKAYYTILILYLIDELYRIKVIDIIGAYNPELDCIDPINDVIDDYAFSKDEPYWSSVAKNLLSSPTF